MLSSNSNEKPLPVLITHHLWAKDPEIAKIRRILLFYWLRSSIIFWILILLIALIYLGSGVNPVWHTKSLDVYVTSFDKGLAGSFFIEAFQDTPPGNQTLNWIFQDSSDLTTADLRAQIDQGKAWASVYMNAGISDQLNAILQSILSGKSLTSSYRPSSAVTIVYDQGRNFNGVNGFVLPPIRAAILAASAHYSAYFRTQVDQSTNATLANVLVGISLANITHNPIGSIDMNTHPAAPYPSVLGTTLGYLFLWLITLNSVATSLRITGPFAGKIKIIDIVIIRITNTVLNGLILALIFSLTILWFSSFTAAVPFIRFWLFNWLAVITFSVIIVLFVNNLGALAQVGLTLFIITNLAASTSNIPIELQNRFYRIGYGLPLYHCFSGGRHFLFGSYTKLNVDLAVLFAYYIGGTISVLITGIYRMRKQEQQILKKNREAAENKRRTKMKIVSQRK